MSSPLTSIRNLAVPIRREGYPFIAIAVTAAFALFLLWAPMGWLALLVAAWVTYFFRDPPRVTPLREGLVVSGADGRVSQVAHAVAPPELGLGPEPLLRISVFMNVFDVHVNRMPVSGRIAAIAYRPGKFLNAELDKASEDNERNGLLVETAAGGCVGVVQIAGLVARRIVCLVAQGDTLGAGERIGLIRFGSRVDVYLPAGTTPLVAEGQRAIAGETVLADLAAPPPSPTVWRTS